MEAIACATDGVRWRDDVDPEVEDRLAAAVDELALLPVVDATVARIAAAVADQDTATADLVAIVEADPPFARRLMAQLDGRRRGAQPVNATLREAVVATERSALPRLALEASVHRFLDEAPGTRSGRTRLHHAAAAAASAAVAIAERTGVDPGVPHLAALLHDAGELVLALAFGPAACGALVLRHPDEPGRARAQREELGVDHAVAGAMLAERWNLPEGVPEAIALHHGGATGAESPAPEIAVVQLAAQVARLQAGLDADLALRQRALDRCGARPPLLDELVRAPRFAPAGGARSGRQPSVSSRPRSATSAASSVL